MTARPKRLRADREQELRDGIAKGQDAAEIRLFPKDAAALLAEIDYLREQNQNAQVYATQLKQRIKGLGG